MINILASLFLFILNSDNAINDASKISSTHASYDGSTLLLEGTVNVEHALGKMTSEIAHLEKQEANKDLPFSKIWLKQNVQMDLKNNGQLFCEIADIDFTHLKGLLLPKTGEKVVYKDGNGTLELLSDSAEIALLKSADANEKLDYIVTEIRALDEVLIHYENDFSLHADLAIYERTSSDENLPRVTCSVNQADAHCTLVHENDLVHAKLVKFYPENSKMVLVDPKGHLFSTILPGIQKGPVNFESHLLSWDQAANTLLLKGNAVVTEAVLGEIRCDDQILVKKKEGNEKEAIQSITTQGMTSLKHVDSLTNLSHSLISYGSLTVDNDAGKIFITSPKSGKETPENQQIYYEQGDIAMQANDASLEYAMNEGHFQPKEILLTGNVHLNALNLKSSPRCALADQVVYHPLKKELILSANSGKKVLFWDESEGISISARQIYITTDEQTEKESIKGVGSVSFAFNTAENQLLKKVFPFYHPPLLTYESTNE